MAHTDKTKRLKFQMNDKEFSWNTHRTTNKERLVVGPKGIRLAKRYRSKRNRRRSEPLTTMSGYGYGYENYRYCFSD